MARIWRLLAPMEESKPNWRVRSATEMANALKISDAEAMTMIAHTIPASWYNVAQTERLSVMNKQRRSESCVEMVKTPPKYDSTSVTRSPTVEIP